MGRGKCLVKRRGEYGVGFLRWVHNGGSLRNGRGNRRTRNSGKPELGQRAMPIAQCPLPLVHILGPIASFVTFFVWVMCETRLRGKGGLKGGSYLGMLGGARGGARGDIERVLVNQHRGVMVLPNFGISKLPEWSLHKIWIIPYSALKFTTDMNGQQWIIFYWKNLITFAI